MSPIIFSAVRAAAVLAAVALAACQDPVAVSPRPSPSTDTPPPATPAEATPAWNGVARDLVAKHSTSVPASIRIFALLSVAQYNAVVAVERASAAPQGGGARPRLSVRGAVAGASEAVLAYAYPQEADFLAALAAQQRTAAGPARERPEDFAAGEDVGRTVAAPLIARAQADRFSAPFAGSVPLCPGCWRADPTPPAFATLGQAKPYFLTSAAQFRPAPPPEFGSPAFLAALAEVRRIADTRSATQDSVAKFWALPAGTIGAQGHFNRVAAELIARHPRSEREAARTLALLNMAAFDAIVASHEAKYHYWLIRPSQADPQIVRAIGLPSFPSYPSNHATLSGVAAAVLGAAFPAERGRLDAMAEDGAISRVYGGIHYRFDTDAGLALGRRVAAWTLAHDVAADAAFVLQP
jgi:membrane-associated phospholipid phosphatase